MADLKLDMALGNLLRTPATSDVPTQLAAAQQFMRKTQEHPAKHHESRDSTVTFKRAPLAFVGSLVLGIAQVGGLSKELVVQGFLRFGIGPMCWIQLGNANILLMVVF